MLSTSYEAFYAMDNLRHRANLSYAQMAGLMYWDDIQYRATRNKVMAGEQSGLNGHIDLKVRYAISFLIFGLDKDYLPLDKVSTPSGAVMQLSKLGELNLAHLNFMEGKYITNDPLGYIAARNERKEQLIPTEDLIKFALKYSERDN